ncbi:MAG: sulfotransferase domain-containing protein [Chloroflexi bacterium]|nr:sulfotransferase domain-containing protein [Chloroflexota bacterium]
MNTVFHITHVKSGSQWVYQILEECTPTRIVKPRVKVAQFYEDPILPGKVYPTVYVPYDRFAPTFIPKVKPAPHVSAFQNWQNFVEGKAPWKAFVVVRDLRDTLISLYFSLKVSHEIISNNVANEHRVLSELSFEDGILHLFGAGNGKLIARIQTSWLEASKRGEARLFRYEDMIADEIGQYEQIMDYCEMDIPRARLHEIVTRCSFAKQTGRKPGQEDVSSHFRKGISGDWKNHFTEKISTEFKKQFGQVLIDMGYEENLEW